MPKRHFHAIGNYYHIVLRGNRREALISTVEDRRALNEIAIDALQRFNATLHAYCLMPNQLRALVQIEDRLLVKALRLTVSRYALHRRRHSKSAANVFERPYEAQRVDTDGEFLNLLRCIHLTPVIANTVTAPADYRWSSHRAYVGYASVAWINTGFGLSLLAADETHARAAYHQLMDAGISEKLASDADTRAQSVDKKLPSTRMLASRTSTKTSFSLTNSRLKLRSISKRALSRFVRNRKQKSASRFLSIY